MKWLFAALTGIGFVEVITRLPVSPTIAQFSATVTKVIAVIGSSKISDHWKEKILPYYAFRLFKVTMLISISLFVAVIPFFALLAISIAMKIPFLEFAMSWIGIVFSTIIAAIYAKVRSSCVSAKL